MVLLFTSLAMIAAAEPAPEAALAKRLKFKQDGTFKIIQLADLQESRYSSNITKDFLLDLARSEQPDLFVLTGDNITDAKSNKKNPEKSRALVKKSIAVFMDVFDEIYRQYGIPVTMVLGNHDAEAVKSVNREDQFNMYAEHESFIGIAIPEADEGAVGLNNPHYGTHNLLVYDKNDNEPTFNIWMFDSGDYSHEGFGWAYDAVQKPQIDWFNKTNAELGKLPSVAFQHIIVPEIFDFLTPAQPDEKNSFKYKLYQYNEPGYGEENLVLVDGKPVEIEKHVSAVLPDGMKGELNEYPCPGKFNYGQYAALSEAGNIHALFVGHEHKNTFEIRRDDGTDLVNTPASGFGSYGKAKLRGVRVITLNEEDLSDYETEVIFYNDYYSGWLRWTRLRLFEGIKYYANPIDAVIFRPLLRLIDRIKGTA